MGALIEARDAYMRGVAKERARIAQDLHDDVSARLLTSLHRRSADMMRKDVREAMADIRTIVADTAQTWRPMEEVLADIRFETMNRLEAYDIALDWPVLDAPQTSYVIDYATARHLLSIVRELLSNVAKHAEASRVSVEVEVDAGRLKLRISDDGIGLNAEAEWGNGLLNTSRRAALIKGDFHIRRGEVGTIALVEIGLVTGGRPSL
ncbi:MAG: hypothetical protein EOP58_15100 [Sphingomonadales bacterium]|nr:MAG: hypothetical protein EOP58_15100 [Sphingomonadales bacterium]